MINAAGKQLIKDFEGCMLGAYKCPAGVWTIGYGHTKGVYEGMKINQNIADTMLDKDLEEVEHQVRKLVMVPITANQLAALIAFCFNVGQGNLAKSTLLKKLNSCDYKGAADEFLKWTRAGGNVLTGLVKRRSAEKDLFLTT